MHESVSKDRVLNFFKKSKFEPLEGWDSSCNQHRCLLRFAEDQTRYDHLTYSSINSSQIDAIIFPLQVGKLSFKESSLLAKNCTWRLEAGFEPKFVWVCLLPSWTLHYVAYRIRTLWISLIACVWVITCKRRKVHKSRSVASIKS